MHVGFANLDEAEPDDRVHVDLAVVGSLADKLVVNLTFRRNINDDVRLQRRLAGQAPPGGKPFLVGVALFDGSHTAQAVGAGGDAVLGEFAAPDIDLTASAQGTAAADGIDINAERARRLQNGGARRNAALPA